MGVYSFADVQCAITGPGGSFSLTGETGVTDEGIEIEYAGDKNTLTMGADGKGQHNLHQDRSGTITIRYLKRSPLNAQLSDLYSYQTTSAAFHGQNIISLSNPVTGETVTATQVAFKKHPRNAHGKDGPAIEWTFDAISIVTKFGSGGPAF